jgi:hypothetical protein
MRGCVGGVAVEGERREGEEIPTPHCRMSRTVVGDAAKERNETSSPMVSPRVVAVARLGAHTVAHRLRNEDPWLRNSDPA